MSEETKQKIAKARTGQRLSDEIKKKRAKAKSQSSDSQVFWQKTISNNLPLSVSNMNQALGGFSFHLLIIIFFADPYIEFSKTFIIAMSHQIFLVSFGAFTILMFLIKKNSASKTVSIFFLIPPTSAFMAWLFLNEKLSNLDLLGFFIATIGVYIATRDK